MTIHTKAEAHRPRRRYVPRRQARLGDFVEAIRRRSEDLHRSFKTQLRDRDAAMAGMFEEWMRGLEREAFVRLVRAANAGELLPSLEQLMPEPRLDDVVREGRTGAK